MADLEAVARWHEELAKGASTKIGLKVLIHTDLLHDIVIHCRAAASACREAIIRRNDPETKGYESASTRAAAAETDAAIDAIKEAP